MAEIILKIGDPGKLAGLESADNNRHEDYKSNKRKTYHGKLLIFIKPDNQEAGMLNITLTSTGIKSKFIKSEIN